MDFGITIIGAGVIGLAVAERLSGSGCELLVLEQHDGFGKETSSRNSEVIHAGFYYETGSLKARLCVEGNGMMYRFCHEHQIPCRRVGKLLVANTPDEEVKVEKLYELGIINGVKGLQLLDRKGILALEPHINGRCGFFSPDSGIIDSHSLMKVLENRAISKGTTFGYSCNITEISFNGRNYELQVVDSDGESIHIKTGVIINCAGLSSDRIAAMVGINPDSAGYRLKLCKGEYFSVSGRHRGKVSHLIYPAPTPISLGVHGVLGLDDSFRLGPSAFYVDTIDYTVDSSNAAEFLVRGRELFPFIEDLDLSPAMSGIRPKLVQERNSFRDFIICEESSKGLPGFINLIGIESPGLTSSLAIAAYVQKIYDNL
ncbi:MAG: NAD(P)/FAD-dependent oxidoreductase [Fibrobacter sp.]|nr:NAD(P)/FAD-dependent oxidoreductase [Fibrobacter sp.]